MRGAFLLELAKRNRWVLERTLADLTHEQSLLRLVEGGSHLNWLVAHLVAGRDHMLDELGAKRVRPREVDDAYDYGSTPPTGEEARPFEEHVADLGRTFERLEAALERATEEELAAPLGNGTLADRLQFRLWHEAYHAGQTTLYRAKAGLESPIG